MKTRNQMKIVAEPGKQEMFIYREFDAPREAVFKAYTDPKLIVQWLGPDNMEMKIEKFDMKTGGSYRYIHSDGKGNSYGFHGSVHAVNAPQRVIQTFEFEGLPETGHVILDTADFEQLPNNRCKLTIHSVYRSVSDRDGMVASGMEAGMQQGFEKLDAILTK